MATYYDKYHCINCPVEKYCGTMVSCIRLCHSYNDATAENQKASHVLTLSEAAPDLEEEEIESKITMWDNVTD